MQPITDLKAFLEDAKAELISLNDLNKKLTDLTNIKANLEDDYADAKKGLEKEIELTVNKRRKEISKTYDDELSKGEKNLDTVRSKREKAKNQGIKERISEETAQLRKENKDISNEIKADYRSKGVPGLCDTKLFYSLFCPKSFGDYLKIALAIVILFLVIPVGVYYLFFKTKGTIALIIIYFIDILVFGGLILLIYKKTVAKFRDEIAHAMARRKVIRTNDKKIKEIIQVIKEDKSEDKYNLTSYDDEIANIKQSLADITMKKTEALNTFDNVTKNIITDEITSKVQPRLDELSDRLKKAEEEYNIVSEDRKNKSMAFSDNYGAYLGKEFSSVEKLDALITVAEHSTATNLNEVIEEYRRGTEY